MGIYDNIYPAVSNSPFEPATASADGKQGLVPAPLAGQEGDFLKGDGTWSPAVVPGGGSVTDNAVVRFDGTTGSSIQESTVTLSDTGDFNGVLSINNTGGDLGLNTVTSGDIALAAAGNVTIQGLTYPSADGSGGQFLKTDGLGNLSFANAYTAPIPVADGGTGAQTLTQNGILYGNGTSAIAATSALSNGQLLVGSTGNAPVAATLTAGSGISITNGAGSITIAASGGGGATAGAWTTITKSINESKTNNTTFATDAELFVALDASSVYVIRGQIIYSSNATPDFKIRFAISSSNATAITGTYTRNDSTIADNVNYYSFTPSALITPPVHNVADTTVYVNHFDFVVSTSAATNFYVQWAQSVSNASAATVYAGSNIIYAKGA